MMSKSMDGTIRQFRAWFETRKSQFIGMGSCSTTAKTNVHLKHHSNLQSPKKKTAPRYDQRVTLEPPSYDDVYPNTGPTSNITAIAFVICTATKAASASNEIDGYNNITSSSNPQYVSQMVATAITTIANTLATLSVAHEQVAVDALIAVVADAANAVAASHSTPRSRRIPINSHDGFHPDNFNVAGVMGRGLSKASERIILLALPMIICNTTRPILAAPPHFARAVANAMNRIIALVANDVSNAPVGRRADTAAEYASYASRIADGVYQGHCSCASAFKDKDEPSSPL